MLDGAGASTFLDLIDERNQEEIKKNSKIIDTPKDNNEVPFANTARDQNKKNVVFIDSAVSDYETIINSFKENTEFYLINSNEDGFKRISEILNDRKDIDGLHIIGHGSAGEILFGNAFLNNDTITNYQSTLASIGQSLTTSGDILFYGCNVASTDQGEILIKKISEITKADIAASDDITGKGGDWDLEKKYGIIETENIKVLGYEDDLDHQDGVSGRSGNIVEYTDTNVSKSNSGTKIMVKLEKQHVSVNSSSYVSQHSITSSISMSGSNSTGQMSYNNLRTFNQATGETSGVVNSYLLFHTTNGDDSGTVTFDGEIIGIFWDVSYIHSNLNSSTNSSSNASTVRSLYNNSSLSYETNALPGLVMENNGTGTGNSYTYRYGNSSNTNYDNDRVAVTSSGGTNNKLHMRVSDGNGGDYIRVIVKVNVDPSAVADTGYIQEGKTLTVANSGSAVAGTTTGRNTGDITDNDTDANNDSLTVTHIQHSGAGSSTSVTNVTYNHGSATSVSGTYGTLTIGSDGSYQYVASSDINNLDAGEANVTDVFTYTVSDGNGGTDTETLTINVIPSQDLTARNDTGTVNEDATLDC